MEDKRRQRRDLGGVDDGGEESEVALDRGYDKMLGSSVAPGHGKHLRAC